MPASEISKNGATAPPLPNDVHPDDKDRSTLHVAVSYTAAYAWYYTTNILFLALSPPLFIVMLPFANARRRLVRWMIHVYGRFLTQRVLPFLDATHIDEVTGLTPDTMPSPCIYVSNHRGRLDALLLLGLFRNAGVLIKSKHARFPVLAYLVRSCGFVSVDRSSATSIAAAIDKCATVIEQGTNLILFPEGTRTAGARLQRFGSLAFKIAVDRRIPIVPVVTYSRNGFMCKSFASFYPRRRIGYRIHVLPPLFPIEGQTFEQLSDRAYKAMSNEVKAMAAIAGAE